jgi:hypothetical protein
MGIALEEQLVLCGMKLWEIKETDSEFRQFVFKWNQGMVHGNTVISHFGEVDRKCTFCKLKEIERVRQEEGRDLSQAEIDQLIVVDENRPHILWECVIVQNCIQQVYRYIWETDNDVDKKDFLMGRNLVTEEATMLYMMINMFIKYKIWAYKLAGVLPKVRYIQYDVQRWIGSISWYNKWRMMLPVIRQHVRG